MAFSLNRAQVIGNVTRDPEVRMAGSTKVASFGVATNITWKDQATGQRKEKVEFHSIVVWRGLADICEQYVRKGSKIFVEGRLQTRDWEGKDGVKRSKTEIVADNIILLDRKGQAMSGGMAGSSMERTQGGIKQSEGGASEDAQTQNAPAVVAAASEEEVSIDDLPF